MIVRRRTFQNVRKLLIIIFIAGFLCLYLNTSSGSVKSGGQKRPSIFQVFRFFNPFAISKYPRRGWMKKVPWQQNARLHNYSFLINPSKTCEADKGRIKLLVLIKSAPYNVARRDATRRTYIDYAKKNDISARFVFIVGVNGSVNQETSIHEESKAKGDILQVDYRDHYYNLTVKLIMGFEWALKVCKNFDFVMSTDDDVVVDIVSLVKDLQNLPEQNKSRFMLGKRAYGEGPNRGVNNKWFIPKDMFPGEYPVFPYGHGYIMSHAVLERVYSQSKVTPAMVPFDDVYFGILLDKLGIEIYQRLKFFEAFHPYRKSQDYLRIEVPVRDTTDVWEEFLKNITMEKDRSKL